MNTKAERHLAKAEDYLGKGESFYRKAADEIVAAKRVDDKLSNREVGSRLGRDESWVRKVLAWAQSASPGDAPFAEGPPKTERNERASAAKFLREAPAELVERIVEDLPPQRQKIVAAATGVASAKARQEYEERERNMTPAQRKEREAVGESIDQLAANAMSGFDAFGIANHLDQARDILAEMVAKSTLKPEGLRQIDEALSRFLDEYKVAQATVGEEVGSMTPWGIKPRWEVLQDWIIDEEVSQFTAAQLASSKGISMGEASLLINSHLHSQRGPRSRTLLVVKRQGRTRNSVWSAGVRTADISILNGTLYEDIRVKVMRAWRPDLRQLAVVNPRAARKAELYLGSVIDGALVVMAGALGVAADDEE